MLPGKSLVFMDEAAALETILCQVLRPLVHHMLTQTFEFLCLNHVLCISPLVEGLNSSDFLHGLDWCGSHGSSDDPESLILDLIQGMLVGLCCC